MDRVRNIKRKVRTEGKASALVSKKQVRQMIKSALADEEPSPHFIDQGLFVPTVSNGSGSFNNYWLTPIPLFDPAVIESQQTRTSQSVRLLSLHLSWRANVGIPIAGELTATKMRIVISVVKGWDQRSAPLAASEMFESGAIATSFGSLSPFNFENVEGKASGRRGKGAYIKILWEKTVTLCSGGIGAIGGEDTLQLNEVVTFEDAAVGNPALSTLVDNYLNLSVIADDAVAPFPQFEWFVRTTFIDI